MIDPIKFGQFFRHCLSDQWLIDQYSFHLQEISADAAQEMLERPKRLFVAIRKLQRHLDEHVRAAGDAYYVSFYPQIIGRICFEFSAPITTTPTPLQPPLNRVHEVTSHINAYLGTNMANTVYSEFLLDFGGEQDVKKWIERSKFDAVIKFVTDVHADRRVAFTFFKHFNCPRIAP